MVFNLFDILTQSIAITVSMLNFGNIFTKKNAINFYLTEIKKYIIWLKLCCVSNNTIKNVEIAEKNQPFPKCFQ